jgi:hypothetical protein
MHRSCSGGGENLEKSGPGGIIRSITYKVISGGVLNVREGSQASTHQCRSMSTTPLSYKGPVYSKQILNRCPRRIHPDCIYGS